MPATGLSLTLIAIGAILAFAVTQTVAGVSIQLIGVIVLLVGILGLLLAVLFLMSFSPFRSGRPSPVERVDSVDIHHVE